MKTLIIHPKDRSTSFLDIVYRDLENKTLITGGLTKKELKEKMECHDRIIMMGHGAPSGLFNVSSFPVSNLHKLDSLYIIDKTFVDLLSEKEAIFIWCNADKFVREFNLKGFFSGMFISEVSEAHYCGIRTVQSVVDESNHKFCEILSQVIGKSNKEIYDHVMREYGELALENEVAMYNHQRLYLENHEVKI